MGLKNISFGNQQNVYAGYSREDLLKSFQNDNWKSLDADHKEQLLQETARMYSREVGINDVPTIKQESIPGCYGVYNGWSNSIKLDLSKCDSSYQALDTLAHELNHAYQKQCIENNTGKYSDEERALLTAENGKAYANSGMSYHRQSLEVDSNNAGLGFVLDAKGNYKPDVAMVEYLQNRAVHFEVLGSDYKDYKMACVNSELRQIDKAERFGEITPDEKILAENCVLGNNNSIKNDMLSLREEVKQTYIETAVKYEESKFAENNMTFDERKNSIFQTTEQQHQKFEQMRQDYLAGKDVTMADTMKLQLSNQVNATMLQNMKAELSTQRAEAMAALSAYVYEHNMTRFDTEKDAYCQQLSNQIKEIDQQISNCNYKETQLMSDNSIIAEETGYKVEPCETLNQKQDGLETAEQNGNDKMQVTKDEELSNINNDEKQETTENEQDEENLNNAKTEEAVKNDLDDGLEDLGHSKSEEESLENDLDDGLEDLGHSNSEEESLENDLDDGLEDLGPVNGEEKSVENVLDDGLEDLGHVNSEEENAENDLDDGLEDQGHNNSEQESAENDLDDGLGESAGSGEGTGNDSGQSQGASNTADHGSSADVGSGSSNGSDNSNDASYDE